MSDKTVVKGKVVKENIELWDKTWPNEPKNYHHTQGVVDFVVTPNVLSWVNQGLVELYKGGAKNAAPVEAPVSKSVEEPTKKDSSKDVAKEAEPKKKKKSSKQKG